MRGRLSARRLRLPLLAAGADAPLAPAVRTAYSPTTYARAPTYDREPGATFTAWVRGGRPGMLRVLARAPPFFFLPGRPGNLGGTGVARGVRVPGRSSLHALATTGEDETMSAWPRILPQGLPL